ncbi:MAG: Na+/H+ antiporter NhaA [Rhodospirillaceae bacterium]
MNPDTTPVNKEMLGGLLLIGAAIIALIVANSPLAGLYETILSTPVQVLIGGNGIDKPLLLWINDGLMVLFFFLVGLEIKRELLEGTLSDTRKAILPLAGAIGGIVAPALVYAFFNWEDAEALRGWAIPAATDIAFVVGILALMGSRVPVSLKVFVLALAIIDDVGAIVIIAVFYTESVEMIPLAIAGVATVVLAMFNRRNVTDLAPYMMIGFVLWVSVLKSDVHATLAGVLLAMFIPMRNKRDPSKSPVRDLEHALHPSVAFGVIPVFAFANAGVSFSGLSLESAFGTVPLGIALGLFLGKQFGVFAFCWTAIKLGWAQLPAGASWLQLYGVGILTGVGFTMSLFIGTLALDPQAYATDLRLGVLGGSLLSILVGVSVLMLAQNKEGKPVPKATGRSAQSASLQTSQV